MLEVNRTMSRKKMDRKRERQELFNRLNETISCLVNYDSDESIDVEMVDRAGESSSRMNTSQHRPTTGAPRNLAHIKREHEDYYEEVFSASTLPRENASMKPHDPTYERLMTCCTNGTFNYLKAGRIICQLEMEGFKIADGVQRFVNDRHSAISSLHRDPTVLNGVPVEDVVLTIEASNFIMNSVIMTQTQQARQVVELDPRPQKKLKKNEGFEIDVYAPFPAAVTFEFPTPFQVPSTDYIRSWIRPDASMNGQLRNFLRHIFKQLTIPADYIKNYTYRKTNNAGNRGVGLSDLPLPVVSYIKELVNAVYGFNLPELSLPLDQLDLDNSSFIRSLSLDVSERWTILTDMRNLRKSFISIDVPEQIKRALGDVRACSAQEDMWIPAKKRKENNDVKPGPTTTPNLAASMTPITYTCT